MGLDAEYASPDCREIDIEGSATDEISVMGRFVEVVEGPASAPYGTLLVKLAGSAGEYRPLTRLEIGWEHAMQVIGVRRSGSTVTRIRVWT